MLRLHNQHAARDRQVGMGYCTIVSHYLIVQFVPV
jgi:hypothetical protein